MTKNLISVSQLTRDHDLVAEFNSFSCLIKDKNSGLVLLRGFLKDGLYQLHSAFGHASSTSTQPLKSKLRVFCSPHTFPSANKCNRPDSFSSRLPMIVNVACHSTLCNQWHAKLGHPSFHILKMVLNKINIHCSSSTLSFCDSCKVGKLHQLPFTDCSITAIQPFELIYSDLWGPSLAVSIEGYLYYIVFVDAYT